MGFLNGAYGKLMAGKLVRDIQYRQTRVQSRLRRVTRQIGDMEKLLQRQQKQVEANLKNQSQFMVYELMKKAGFNVGDPNNLQQFMGIDQSNYGAFQACQMQVQTATAMAQSMWENIFDMQREAMLEPLKDEEEALQTEKDNLESRLQIAKNEYDAKKQEEKDGARIIQDF